MLQNSYVVIASVIVFLIVFIGLVMFILSTYKMAEKEEEVAEKKEDMGMVPETHEK